MGPTDPCSLRIPLKDGREVVVRPITGGDSERLVRFHSSLSDRSIYQRYFAAHPRLSEAEVYRYTHVDHSAREAYVALQEDELVGVGRWERIDEESAEVAFLIADEYQGLGLGSVLFALLSQAARSRGIRQFVAEVLPQNRAMIRLFEDLGEDFRKRTEEGTVTLRVSLPDLAAGALEADE